MFVLEQYHCKAIKGTGVPERGEGRGEEIVLCSAGRGGSAAEAHRRCLFVRDVCLHVWPFISGNRSSKQLRAHKKNEAAHPSTPFFSFLFFFLYHYIHISTLETIQSVPVVNRQEINPLLLAFISFPPFYPLLLFY